jgi:hypothetical protein
MAKILAVDFSRSMKPALVKNAPLASVVVAADAVAMVAAALAAVAVVALEVVALEVVALEVVALEVVAVAVVATVVAAVVVEKSGSVMIVVRVDTKVVAAVKSAGNTPRPSLFAVMRFRGSSQSDLSQ